MPSGLETEGPEKEAKYMSNYNKPDLPPIGTYLFSGMYKA